MLLLILLLQTIFSKPLVPRKNILAIDCGGFYELRTSIGVKYQKDNNYTQSEQVDYFQQPEYTRPKIRYTNDYHIYMTQRQSDYEFSYLLHLNQSQDSIQKFVLILQFAELNFKEKNARLFNIALGKQIVIESLDVFDKVGAKSAYEIYLEIELDNGQLFYEGMLCEKINNHFTLRFIPIVDRPMIAGIMLFKGSLADTDFQEKELQRQQWEDANKDLTSEEKKEMRRQRAEQRELEVKQKQETIKVRNGFTHEIESQVETAKFEWPDMRFELFLMMLQTPLGAVMIVGFLTVMFVSVTFIFFDPYGYKRLNEEMAQLKRKKLMKLKQ